MTSWTAFHDLPEAQRKGVNGPDIVACDGSGTVGIEISNLYIRPGRDNRALQNQIRLRENVIKLTQRCLAERGVQLDRDVSLGFEESSEIKDRPHQRQLAEQVADQIQQIIAEQKFAQLIKSKGELREFYNLWVSASEVEQVSWRKMSVFSVQNLQNENIVQKISEKSSKQLHYLPCDHHWLLLVIDFWNPAQEQSIPRAGPLQVSKTPFEKILVFRTIINEWMQVPQA